MTACVLLLAAACSSTGGDLRSGPSGVMRLAAIAAGPFTEDFNPLLASSISTSGYADRAIYEPLLMDDVAHGASRPWLVTSFSWADAGRSLTLNLRSDVKWSDGQPMTADDVAFTFRLFKPYPALNLYGLQVADATALAPDRAVITAQLLDGLAEALGDLAPALQLEHGPVLAAGLAQGEASNHCPNEHRQAPKHGHQRVSEVGLRLHPVGGPRPRASGSSQGGSTRAAQRMAPTTRTPRAISQSNHKPRTLRQSERSHGPT